MSRDTTAAYTFGDLVTEVARQLGIAYYGEQGNQPASAPVNAHDLDACKRYVNEGLRSFFLQAPPGGWMWAKSRVTIPLWNSVVAAASRTLTSAIVGGQCVVTANTAVFQETMEEKTINLTGGASLVVKEYLSPTQVVAYGSLVQTTPVTYSITADGEYTLPRSFTGYYDASGIIQQNGSSVPCYVQWVSEDLVTAGRMSRTSPTISAIASIYAKAAVSGRPRYVLGTPSTGGVFTLSYEQTFNALANLSDPLPTPVVHDLTVRHACLAAAEQGTDGVLGMWTSQFREHSLPASYNLDRRLAPKSVPPMLSSTNREMNCCPSYPYVVSPP